MSLLSSVAGKIGGAAVSARRRIGAVPRGIAARLPRPSRRVREAVALLPALLAGAGVFLVVAGLFNYFAPSSGPGPTATPTPAAAATSEPFTLPPIASGSPSITPSQGPGAVATRLVVPALNIDLPVVAAGPNERYPLCDAAEWLVAGRTYAYPGAAQPTYLYAHARDGMFGPFLEASMVDDGAALIGMWIELYSDDNQRHIYEITRVLRHVPNSPSFLSEVSAATTDQLWLQTSEGHADTSFKLQIVAMPVGIVAAASAADAHPTGTGTVCPDAPVCETADQTGCRPK
jgi:hypothetical protein